MKSWASMARSTEKPEITGWAQVNGRNAITWEEKFKLDVWYVDNWSLCLDIKIIFMTIWKIFKREGINQPGQATMEEFMGTFGTDANRVSKLSKNSLGGAK
jgi:sugar transferase EpsL